MSWLQPALIATFSNTAILALVFLYLYIKERQKSLLIFFISWSIYSLRFVAMLLHVQFDKTFLLITNQLLVIISSFLLLTAFNIWLNRKPSPLTIKYASLAFIGWTIGIGILGLPFTSYTIPIFFYVGILYIYMGILLLRSSQKHLSGIKIIAITLIIWGLHKMDYPFLRPLEWFAPWGYLLAAVAAVITGIGMILIYFETNKMRLNVLLNEKEVLIHEVHHRIKNHMNTISAILSLRSSYSEDPHIHEVFEEVQNKIRLMQKIYQTLYTGEKVDTIHIDSFFQQLIQDIRASYIKNQSIKFETDIENIEVTSKQSLPIGIIITELITNSIKYAFEGSEEGTIFISIHKADTNFIKIQVADNGAGIHDEIVENESYGFGLTLVNGYVEQFEGEMSIDNTDGTSISITMALEE